MYTNLCEQVTLELHVACSDDHPHVVAGMGTIGLELVEQMRGQLDAVVVPVGAAGLLAGIAVAVKSLSPSTKMIVCGFTRFMCTLL